MSNQVLELHLLESHNKKICPKCAVLIESESLIEHMKTTHFHVECEICGVLKSLVMMDFHLKEVHAFQQCPKCGVVMEGRKLNKHMKNFHK